MEESRNNACAIFEIFWRAYPKKRSKGDAERAWKKIKPDELLFQKILKALEIAKKSWDWKKEKGRYIPYPATWLNAKGWEDEIPEEPQRPETHPSAQATTEFNPCPSHILEKMKEVLKKKDKIILGIPNRKVINKPIPHEPSPAELEAAKKKKEADRGRLNEPQDKKGGDLFVDK